jgi:hypothetical protein
MIGIAPAADAVRALFHVRRARSDPSIFFYLLYFPRHCRPIRGPALSCSRQKHGGFSKFPAI